MCKMQSRLDEMVAEQIELISGFDQDTVKRSLMEKSAELKRVIPPNFFMAFAANIGFGKTTDTNIVAKHGEFVAIRENLENPFLSLYYPTDETKNEYSELLQISFMHERPYDYIINRITNPGTAIVSDRTDYEDMVVFTMALHEMGHMTDNQLRHCQECFVGYRNILEKRRGINLTPNFICFLQGSIETGWARVQERERKMEVEGGLPFELYQCFQNQYDYFQERLKEYCPSPLLILPQDVPIADKKNGKNELYVVSTVLEAVKIIKR